MNRCTLRAHVDRHFEGTISPRDERAMREHLPACGACRGYYQRHLVLSGLDPTALPGEERLARGLGIGRHGPARVLAGVGAMGVAAAAIVLLSRVGSPAGHFEARGAVVPPPPCRIYVYDVPPDAAPSLAGPSVGARDELAFAYENGAGRSRLMVFGVDEHHDVYWFYPAYTSDREDPVAVPIDTDSRRHALPDAVRHHFDGARLSVRALFLDAPVSVHQVEALLQTYPSGPLPLPGVNESSVSLSLVP